MLQAVDGEWVSFLLAIHSYWEDLNFRRPQEVRRQRVVYPDHIPDTSGR